MDFTFQTFILLPIGLGLLGFIEPCTIGGHLLFLGTQEDRGPGDKIKAAFIFVAARTVVVGLIGALIAFLGQSLISVQTGFWLVFGLIYLAIGLLYLSGRAGVIKKQIDLAPVSWKRAQNPLVLGLAFGLNIPACAAPIMFGLLGLAATKGSSLAGFTMMALFGLALSAPLLVIAVLPKLARGLDNLSQKLRQMRWFLGGIFVLLGIWSIWFGLYVDPVNWSGQ
ncbi:MAG: sulfite exporter TauE/SafE family protein [Sneathiella sp.]|nr:sulfite exporter TauE/SafE family protein [Sneathiella sp.]